MRFGLAASSLHVSFAVHCYSDLWYWGFLESDPWHVKRWGGIDCLHLKTNRKKEKGLLRYSKYSGHAENPVPSSSSCDSPNPMSSPSRSLEDTLHFVIDSAQSLQCSRTPAPEVSRARSARVLGLLGVLEFMVHRFQAVMCNLLCCHSLRVWTVKDVA